jgi:hypothetical protein
MAGHNVDVATMYLTCAVHNGDVVTTTNSHASTDITDAIPQQTGAVSVVPAVRFSANSKTKTVTRAPIDEAIKDVLMTIYCKRLVAILSRGKKQLCRRDTAYVRINRKCLSDMQTLAIKTA